MEQIDIQSWDLLDLIRDNADEIIEEIGTIDVDGRMYVYCLLGEDYFELYYNEEDISHVRYFAGEEDMRKALTAIKEEFFPKDFDDEEFFEEDE